MLKNIIGKRVVIVMMCTLFVSSLAFGQGRLDKRGVRHGKASLISELNLSKEQQEKIYEIKRSQMNEGHELRQKIQDYRHQLKMSFSDNKFDQKVVEGLIDKIGEGMKQNMKLHLKYYNNLKKVLSEEQMKKLNFMMLFSKGGGMGRAGKLEGRKPHHRKQMRRGGGRMGPPGGMRGKHSGPDGGDDLMPGI